jgi:O-antigen ligase
MKILRLYTSTAYYLLFFILLFLYSFNKFSTLSNGFKIYYFLIPILYIVYIFKQKYNIPYAIKILLFFISIQFLSLVNTFIFHPDVVNIVSFSLFREMIIVALLIPVHSFYFYHRKFFDYLLLVIAGVVAISNLIYYFTFYDFSGRFQGIFGGANEFAYMMVLLIYVIYYNFYRYSHIKFKLFWISILVILHLLVLVTLSRTAIIGLVVFYIFSFPYFHKTLKLWKKILLILIIILLGIYVYELFFKTFELLFNRFTNSEGSSSLGSRMWEILAAINMLNENPWTIIFGNGTSITGSSIFITYYDGLNGGLGTRVHNAYFALIVENGIVSLLVFLYFIFYMIKKILYLKNVFKYVLLGFFMFSIAFLGTIYLFYFLPFWLALFLMVLHTKILDDKDRK